jgi:hypothetical protein
VFISERNLLDSILRTIDRKMEYQKIALNALFLLLSILQKKESEIERKSHNKYLHSHGELYFNSENNRDFL